MVLAVVVLGVCCGAYAGVKTYVAHHEQKESEEDSEESTTVFTASTDNIKSLDFMVDDTETTFEKDDDSWVKKDETDFPVNQTTLDSAASAIASVDSDRVLEDVDDLSEYGLDSPSNTIKIVTKSDEEDGDDITTTLYVGDENSSTSQYYVRKDDDEKTVYLIDSSCVEPFTKSLNDYAQMEDFPAISNTDTITKISVDGDNSYELSKDEDISKPISLIEVIKFANQAFYNGKPSYYKLPTNMTKNFILKYASQSTGEIGGQANSFVDSTLVRVGLSVRVIEIGTKKMQEKEDKLYNIVEQYFPNDRYTVKVTGSSIIFFKGTQYLVFNLFTSLALAIVLIAFFMAWMFKSKRMVLVALIPNIKPKIITAAIMRYFRNPIKASTILVFSIAFGISVDGTIHYLAKYRQELQGTNWSIRSSAVLALQETGQSMIYNAIILFFGFGIFALSDFGGTVALGILVSITLLAAMLSNLILLQSLLPTLDTHTTNKTFQNPKILSEEENKKD